MNKLLALGFVLVAFGLSFTSCDEEDFQITKGNGSKISTFDLWCDYSQAFATRDVDWLRMNDNGSFVLYNCNLIGGTRGIADVNCDVDSLTGQWIKNGDIVTLEVTHENGEESDKTLTLNIEESNLLRNVTPEEAYEQLFELLVNKENKCFDRYSLSCELRTIFKTKQTINDKLLQATTLVLAQASDDEIAELLTEKISQVKSLAEAIIQNMDKEALGEFVVEFMDPQAIKNIVKNLDAEHAETILKNLYAENVDDVKAAVNAMNLETIEAIVETLQQETVEYVIKNINQEIILSLFESASNGVETLYNTVKTA
jgi:predicted regulator of Ras-like GTPase activity (Roadblock/LC7/MglB family)